MAKETDFYSPGEVAQALGLPERRILSMVVSGEMEGQQDEWGRWRIPARAVRQARQVSEPSPDMPEKDTEVPAASNEARGDDATTVSTDSPPPWKSSAASEGEEATRLLPHGGYRGPLAPDPTSDDIAQELAGDLQARLEFAEQAISRLEEEVRRLAEENERLREELGAERDKGVFGKLFRE